MPTIVSGGGGRGGPNIQYPIGQSPLFGARFGGGGGYGMQFGGRGSSPVARKPGSDPVPVPDDLKNLTQFQGVTDYSPEMLLRLRGRGGGTYGITGGINAGYYGDDGTQYNAEGRKTRDGKPYWHPGTPGYQDPNLSRERLAALSSAAGWAGNPMQRNTGVSQGAGLTSPFDQIRRLLEARMGGGF